MPYKNDRGCNGPVQLTHILHRMGITEGKPNRDLPITKDEITDLRILLNTTQDVNQFIQEV